MKILGKPNPLGRVCCLTSKVPRPISCQKPLKTAMFVALAQENKKHF